MLPAQVGAVTAVDFSPAYPYDYAVTASTRVLIYDAHTRRPRTTLSRFKDRAYSGAWRADGRLLVAGGESGLVQARLQPCSVMLSCCMHAQTLENKAYCH